MTVNEMALDAYRARCKRYRVPADLHAELAIDAILESLGRGPDDEHEDRVAAFLAQAERRLAVVR